MRLVLELWSLLRWGVAHARPVDEAPAGLALGRESDREAAARDYEFHYWNPDSGPW